MAREASEVEVAYGILASEIDEQTSFHSTHASNVSLSWHMLESIALQHPDFISELLVKDIEAGFCWWRVSMVNMLAYDVLGKTVHYEREIRGRARPVQERVLEWWHEEGRAAFRGIGDAHSG